MTNEGDEVLSGGNMGPVLRRGDTVVRQAGEWSPAVHRLLRHLAAAGVHGVPDVLTSADPKQEVLTFVNGDVPSYPMPEWVWDEAALRSAALLLRQVHDATTDCSRQGPWRSPVHEPAEVICHNDFAPYNLVFQGSEVVGVIDWDYASPGPRVWDLAYLAYRLVPSSSVDHADGFTERERHLRLELLMDAYGTTLEPVQFRRVVSHRLTELAELSDEMATQLSKPELAGHAKLYRADARDL
ncbi:phosphotransferase [Lapillicoccus sp.]|uniref:phosphotransferase n=1 Tax=Lapillicoccus sp. TaxID=1909287 RepID=UPI0032642E67